MTLDWEASSFDTSAKTSISFNTNYTTFERPASSASSSDCSMVSNGSYSFDTSFSTNTSNVNNTTELLGSCAESGQSLDNSQAKEEKRLLIDAAATTTTTANISHSQPPSSSLSSSSSSQILNSPSDTCDIDIDTDQIRFQNTTFQEIMNFGLIPNLQDRDQQLPITQLHAPLPCYYYYHSMPSTSDAPLTTEHDQHPNTPTDRSIQFATTETNDQPGTSYLPSTRSTRSQAQSRLQSKSQKVQSAPLTPSTRTRRQLRIQSLSHSPQHDASPSDSGNDNNNDTDNEDDYESDESSKTSQINIASRTRRASATSNTNIYTTRRKKNNNNNKKKKNSSSGGIEKPVHRRRAQLPRSKNGCWTCRCRRKKCDEKKPSCGVCESLGLQCAGYSEERPSFMVDKQASADYRAQISKQIKYRKK